METAAQSEAASLVQLSEKLAKAEEEFFNVSRADNSGAHWTWDAETLEKSFKRAGFSVGITTLDQSEERLILPKDLALWFNKEKSSWGAFIAASIGERDFSQVCRLLEERIKEGPIKWKWKSLLLKAVKLN